jgi:hypothetical protein
MTWIKCEIPKKYCRARSDDGGCSMHVVCEPIIEKCRGGWKDPEDHEEGKNPDCGKIEGEYCRAYINPEVKWASDRDCPLCNHLIKETNKKKIRVGQQKQHTR